MITHCIAYRNGQRLDELPVAAISDYLVRQDCFVWVALRDASDSELAALQEEFGLHELAIEDARHGHQRPKIEEYEGGLFAALQFAELGENNQLRIGELHIFAGNNYVISIERGAAGSLTGVRETCERRPQLLSPGFVLYALMDAAVDRYFPIIEQMEAKLEMIEAHIFTKGAAPINIRRLYKLKRKLTTLRHAIAPLLEAVSELRGSRAPAVCQPWQDYFRDIGDHLLRIQSAIDGMREMIATAIQVNLSMVTIDGGEVNKRLAAWAGIFAVATAFAGIWGMNFKTMPELQWEYGYPAALFLIAGTCGLLYFRLKRLGWL